MRKRLRKKKSKQRVVDSIDWWGNPVDVVKEFTDKMKAWRNKWGLAEPRAV